MDKTKEQQEQEFFEWTEQLTERLNSRKQPPPKPKQTEPPPNFKTREDVF
tara:strand:+ start:64 stop:213 length:150 start_codon:yes stop_codon:yes gene_type:complete